MEENKLNELKELKDMLLSDIPSIKYISTKETEKVAKNLEILINDSEEKIRNFFAYLSANVSSLPEMDKIMEVKKLLEHMKLHLEYLK